ncbi:MAG: Dabb family protein [Phycisphaeraceae bacterium]|nr:Dabb family protein [Phycisphaeraceae bacterium]
MVEHMVWIRFKAGVSDARQEEHLAGLRSLAGKIPGVISVKAGKNFTDRSGGYTHGLLVTLTDRRALETYLPHPEHVKVAGPLKQDADLLAMDIET